MKPLVYPLVCPSLFPLNTTAVNTNEVIQFESFCNLIVFIYFWLCWVFVAAWAFL